MCESEASSEFGVFESEACNEFENIESEVLEFGISKVKLHFFRSLSMCESEASQFE